MQRPFHSIYTHRFIRAAVCIPFVRVADPHFNVEQTLGLARGASELNTAVALFPEMGISAYSNEDLFLSAEICEDVWAPIPPSSYAALAGATVLANLSARNITIGKAESRRDLCAAQSGKCIAAYLYSAAGPGESTTDLAWDGHAIIYENNELLAEAERFATQEQIIAADIDLERLAQERMRMTSFNDSGSAHLERVRAIRRIPFEFQVPEGEIPLMRQGGRFP